MAPCGYFLLVIILDIPRRRRLQDKVPNCPSSGGVLNNIICPAVYTSITSPSPFVTAVSCLTSAAMINEFPTERFTCSSGNAVNHDSVPVATK